MLDPIIREIRRLRAKRSKELARDPRKAMEETNRKVLAMASNIVRTGPHTFRATFTLPGEQKKRAQGSRKSGRRPRNTP
jgi:hypothetical protein